MWILLEPAAHIIYLMIVFGVIRHQVRQDANIEVFVLVGVWGFFLVRNIAQRGMEAINANQALFSYRQVRPVDTVLVRASVEAFLYVIVGAILLFALALLNIDVRPADPLLVMWSALLLWMLGLGLGLVFSVIGTLLPGLGKLIRIVFTPLYFLSAVMYSVSSLPRGMRKTVLVNPITHGLEAMRSGWFAAYHGESHINLGYLAFWALATVFLGLAMHMRYATRLTAQ
ncbi:polysialic acid transport ATP-binding protein, ABC-2 [Cupriavidus taiwanensis]|uniref:Transport permease protein n=2 Tax=Cupriavidus taiwanensis TaxID=164546 RepID=A0A375E6F5_9BURK|nr:polysialic acid transport ATP-binding protein, ABC-2 [Cupriavidus taiwanensis]SOZ64350.1 polysialic acid transport ATP-binding protein, ABC-2 [Cupriavidus taiwanensis]SOZ68105.1 polysialic acid transport ATP-binding protein, ABC-2 [Cupriavidus taiwanensis]SPA07916.1 polysialic acid transport ATP-binding protein, ABC-2 [Cupriavidus taiwanensis]